MTIIANSIIGRAIVKPSATMALAIPENAPPGLYEVKVWISEWFARAPQSTPVYFEFTKARCAPDNAPMLPMGSIIHTLRMLPGTALWVCSETDVILNYTVDKVA